MFLKFENGLTLVRGVELLLTASYFVDYPCRIVYFSPTHIIRLFTHAKLVTSYKTIQ